MASIYIHIPFCDSKCSYCNFFSIASKKNTSAWVEALLLEIDLRAEELQAESIETIYVGGGTPSILTVTDIKRIIQKVFDAGTILSNAEITLEVNPEHVTPVFLTELLNSPINRISMGVQTFNENGLQWLDRKHTAASAFKALSMIKHVGFSNYSADLIFGIPNVDVLSDLNVLLQFEVPHISAYAITVEPATILDYKIKKLIKENCSEEKVVDDFLKVMHTLQDRGYEHYELSNYAKSGYHSQHNSAYWQQKKYIGLGPSAHSYNGAQRCWNVSSVSEYIKQINKKVIPSQCEVITATMRYNEYIMTALRTSAGIDIDYMTDTFQYVNDVKFQQAISNYIDNGNLMNYDNKIILTDTGKLISDRIIVDLFME